MNVLEVPNGTFIFNSELVTSNRRVYDRQEIIG